MIKYVVASSRLVKVDTDNFDNIEAIDHSSHAIDWLWIVPEDGICEGKKVKKDDVIVHLYGGHNTGARTVIIPKSEYTKHVIEYNTPIEKKCICDCDCCELKQPA